MSAALQAFLQQYQINKQALGTTRPARAPKQRVRAKSPSPAAARSASPPRAPAAAASAAASRRPTSPLRVKRSSPSVFSSAVQGASSCSSLRKDACLDFVDDCEWIVNKGCRKSSSAHAAAAAEDQNSGPSCSNLRKARCLESAGSGCDWVVGEGCQRNENEQLAFDVESLQARLLQQVERANIADSKRKSLLLSIQDLTFVAPEMLEERTKTIEAYLEKAIASQSLVRVVETAPRLSDIDRARFFREIEKLETTPTNLIRKHAAAINRGIQNTILNRAEAAAVAAVVSSAATAALPSGRKLSRAELQSRAWSEKGKASKAAAAAAAKAGSSSGSDQLQSQSLVSNSAVFRPLESCTFSLQSDRDYQEDRSDSYTTTTADGTPVYAWAVYDGHGGDRVSSHLASNRFIKKLVNALFVKDQMATDAAIQRFYADWDGEFYKDDLNEGSTAIVAIVRGSTLYLINLGDSRAALFTVPDGRVLLETNDHDPSSGAETARIKQVGLPNHQVTVVPRFFQGRRVLDARVGGGLAMSRSFGDSQYKRRRDAKLNEYRADGAVSAVPDVQRYNLLDLARKENLANGDTYLVLASDGVWDCCFIGTDTQNRPLSEAPQSQGATVLFADALSGETATTIGKVCANVINVIEPATGDNKTITMVRIGSSDAAPSQKKPDDAKSNKNVFGDNSWPPQKAWQEIHTIASGEHLGLSPEVTLALAAKVERDYLNNPVISHVEPLPLCPRFVDLSNLKDASNDIRNIYSGRYSCNGMAPETKREFLERLDALLVGNPTARDHYRALADKLYA